MEERPGVRNRRIPCCLYELKVSGPVYRRLRRQLSRMYHQRERYHYNLLGALSCYFNHPLRRKNHYFCSQFLATLLEGAARWSFGKTPTWCARRLLPPVRPASGPPGPLDGLMAAPT